jgi:hypothetical protein
VAIVNKIEPTTATMKMYLGIVMRYSPFPENELHGYLLFSQPTRRRRAAFGASQASARLELALNLVRIFSCNYN